MVKSEWSIDIPTNLFLGVLAGTLVLVATVAVVALVVRLMRTWQPKHQQRAVDEAAKKMNLTVPEHVREPLARAIAVRKRGTEIGALFSLGALLLILRPWSTPLPGLGLTGIIPLVIAGSVGITLGAAIGGFFARRAATTEHRAARLTPLRLPDLLAPVDRRVLVGTLIAGATLPAILTVLVLAPWTRRGDISTGEAVFLLLTGLIAAGTGIALPRIGRMLVAKRAIPGDEHALAWSDALAARTLRDIAHLTITVGALTGFLSFMAIGLTFPARWGNTADAWLTIAGPLGLGILITLIVATLNGQPERHVQRTLWPQFAADAK